MEMTTQTLCTRDLFSNHRAMSGCQRRVAGGVRGRGGPVPRLAGGRHA